MLAVQFDNVSKSYPIYDAPGDRLKELITFNRRAFHRNFWALHDVSFEVRRGETFCVIGENGSGKSTLLQLVARILQPSSGTVAVEGRVSALLELGAGFNPEFTGHDNVYLNGAILGLTKREIDACYGSIEEFAEIGDFINRPVKTYSSGMVVRLAFAVAINVQPEILIGGRSSRGGRPVFPAALHAQGTRVAGARRHDSVRLARHRGREGAGRPGAVAGSRPGVELGATDRVVSKYLAAMTEKDSAYLAHHKPDAREQHRAQYARAGNRGAHSEHRSPVRRPASGDSGHCGSGCGRNTGTIPGAGGTHHRAHQHSGKRGHCSPQCGIPDAESSGRGFRGNEYGPRGTRSAAYGGRRHIHSGLPHSTSGVLPQFFFVLPGYGGRAAGRVPGVRPDRQRHRTPNGGWRRGGVRLHASALPRDGKCAAGRGEEAKRA